MSSHFCCHSFCPVVASWDDEWKSPMLLTVCKKLHKRGREEIEHSPFKILSPPSLKTSLRSSGDRAVPMVCGEDPVCTQAGEENLHLQQPQTENLPRSSAALHYPPTQAAPCPPAPTFWAELFPCLEQGSRKQAHVKHIYKLQNLQLTLPLPRAAQR